MRQQNAWMWALTAAGAVVALMAGLPGCESEPSTSDLDSYFENNPYITNARADGFLPMVVTPSIGGISYANEKLVFRAKGGQGPYFWGVSSSDNGSIATIPGATTYAVYTARAVGPNAVIVSDTMGGAAVANVQTIGADGLRIEPSDVGLVGAPAGPAVNFIVIGGTQPYSDFQVAFPSLGTMAADGTYSVAAPNLKGTNIITVLDAAGDAASATVEHSLVVAPLRIVPNEANIPEDGESAYFVAQGGLVPLAWDRTYPGRGNIAVISGRLIEYTRTAPGENVLRVEDAQGTIALATITQESPTAPVIEPMQATVSSNMTAFVFTVKGGTPSYVWSMETAPGTTGNVSPSTGQQTVFTIGSAARPYTAVIRVTDANSFALAQINVE